MILNNIALSNPKLMHAREHKHKNWEIILNLKGTGIDYMDHKETRFYPGLISICQPETIHGKKVEDGYFHDIFVDFSDSYMLKNLGNCYFEDDSEHTIEKLMLITHNIYKNKKKGYQGISNSLLEAMCGILISWDKNGKTGCVEIVKNQIINNFADFDFKIENAIKHTNYCADHVRRCFKKETGLTPNEYLNRIRIENAKKLLMRDVSPKYSISDVACLSGFNDAGYFSRVFKKLEGTIPSKINSEKQGEAGDILL